MRREWTDDGWRKRFALFPLFLCEGQRRQVVWLEPYWSRFACLYTEISLDDPRNPTPEVPGGSEEEMKS